VNPQNRVAIAIYSTLLALIIVNALVISVPKTYDIESPIHDGFSVLAAERKEIKKKHIIYGFLPYWKLNDTEFLQLNKITDIAYFGLYIEADGTIRKKDDEGFIDPGYNNWKNNENLDTLIASAGDVGTNVAVSIISHRDETTDSFLMCESCWDTLANELIFELNQKGLKDVNFDFEYGEYTDEKYADQYTKLVGYMNERLDASFGDSYVTVATFADSFVKPRVTKVDDLALVADGIFIMAYDFHRPTSDSAGPVAPLGGAGIHAEYDINTMVKDYTKNIPPNKLILGVPYYGYNWVVDQRIPYASRIEGNDAIGYSESQTYAMVMDTVLEVNPAVLWDETAQTPYFSYISPNTGSERMVYFENVDSLRAKYQLAKDLDFAGVGIWALGYDGGYQELWDLLNAEFIL
jgi:spore germination protein YaaH